MKLAFEKMSGLVPAVIQDCRTEEVLMLGFLNLEALEHTQRTGEVHFFSRSRNQLWKKGEKSGHILRVREVRIDCDADPLQIRVEVAGPGVRHEGYRSCFFRAREENGKTRIVTERSFAAEEVYGQKRSE